MVNNVNFTGLKNIGGISCYQQHLQGNFQKQQDYLLVHLTDDYNGHDLAEFNEVVKKCQPDLGVCTFEPGSRFIQIMTKTVNEADNEFNVSAPQLFVNNKLVPVTDNTLPLFSYVAKLTRKIQNMDDKEFVYNKDFKYGLAGRTFMISGFDMINFANRENVSVDEIMDKLYCPMTAKRKAQIINSNIQKQMLDYLG